MNCLEIYEGSSGVATKALYAELERVGRIGIIAMNLFRAQKCSARAKVYRGGVRGLGSYARMAYDRKNWSIDQLTKALILQTEIKFGWGVDESTPAFIHVLYVDLPTGQVSFHSAVRGAGPDYGGLWDGVRNASERRIVEFCQMIYDRRCELIPAAINSSQGSLFA